MDDERFIRSTIKAVLRAIGRFEIAEADDGDVAMGQVERFKPDVVLCDITMPRMGGLRFVELLRKNPEARMRETRVVILTGRAEEATVVAAARLQINGYLIKPVSPKQLSDQLRTVVARRAAAPQVYVPCFTNTMTGFIGMKAADVCDYGLHTGEFRTMTNDADPEYVTVFTNTGIKSWT